MTKTKNIKAASILMVFRDRLRKEASDLLNKAELELAETEKQATAMIKCAKERYHMARIQSNRLNRDADSAQECISDELELEIKTNEEVSAAWDCKSQARLAAEMLSSAPAELRQTSVRLADSELLELGLLKTGDK